MKVYLDNAATTPLEANVLDVMKKTMETVYGNPSSIHAAGRLARTTIEDARKRIANHLKASQGEIFFTSSATESNNTAIQGAVRDLGIKKIISSPTEHPCVLNSIKRVQDEKGAKIEMLIVDEHGRIDIEELREKLKTSDIPTLVSIMHANNEIGTIQDIKSIGDACADYGALFHCDTVQTVGKHDIDVSTSNISFLSGSGHKIYGPKGSGFLYVNNKNIVQPLIVGGGQERNMRSGTENTYGIAGLAAALDNIIENRTDYKRQIDHLVKRFKNNIQAMNMDISFNGCPDNYLAHIVNLSVPQTEKAEMIMMNLDIYGICASAGSACNSGIENASHVIQAIQQSSDRKALRFSFSHHNTIEEVDYVTDTLKNIL
ncbi:MAG: cysteine desulfurase [Saprospiraceae bacterium]|jgi:cysteine desulfurase